MSGSDSGRVFRSPPASARTNFTVFATCNWRGSLLPAKPGEQGKQAAMAKKKRQSRVEIATTQGELQSETAGRTRGEGDKIAEFELELENLRLRR